MTRKMIILITAVVILITAIIGCIFCEDICGSTCTFSKRSGIKDHAACESCGQDACIPSCTDEPVIENVSEEKPLPSCNLTSREQSERIEKLKVNLFKKAKSVIELNDGYDFVFVEPIEFSNQLFEVINFERVCCPYFTWGLIFEPQNKAMHLQIYGSEAIKEELRLVLKDLGLIHIMEL
jgi:hypothetical protein